MKGRGKKGRSVRTYENKCRETESWYNHILKHRQEVDKKGSPKKELRPLDYYIDKIKKPKATKEE